MDEIRVAFFGRPTNQIVSSWTLEAIRECVSACATIEHAGTAELDVGNPLKNQMLPAEDAAEILSCINERVITERILEEISDRVSSLFEELYRELRDNRVRHFLGCLHASRDEIDRIQSSMIQRGLVGILRSGINGGLDHCEFATIDDWIGFCVVCSVRAWQKEAGKKRISTVDLETLGGDIKSGDFQEPDAIKEIEEEYHKMVRVLFTNCLKDDLDRTVVRLYIDGYSFKAIAESVDRVPGVVSRRWSRIRECVRQHYAGK